jgi:hypothetical protein
MRSGALSIGSLLGMLLLGLLMAMFLLALWGTAASGEPALSQGRSPVATATATHIPVQIQASTPTATPRPTQRALGATAVPFPAPTLGPTATPFPAAPQNPRFGIAWSSSFYNSQRVTLPTGQAIEAGATWDRWPMPWYLVEPHADGHFRWVHEDINFFLAATQDKPCYSDPAATDPALRVLVVLTGIPERYVDGHSGESILGLDEPVFLPGDGPPRINPDNRWGHFVYQATSTFGNVVDGWEIGNEGGFPLSPDATVRAMEVACRVIATTDPTAEVLLGSPEHPIALKTARGEETAYRALLTSLAEAIQGDRSLRTCISGLALHVYVQPHYSYYVVSRIADLTASLGWQPALWITETGVQHPDRDRPGGAYRNQCRETGFHCVSDEEQASYLIQQYVLTVQALAHKQRDGVVIYHRLKDEFDRDPRPEVNDGPWGLMDFDNHILPAFDAARLVSATLGRAHYLREEGDDDPTYRHLVFEDHAERLVHVLWATTAQAVTVSLPLGSDLAICYQQSIALCPDEFRSAGGDVLVLALPGATSQAGEDPSDPFHPAPVVGGRTFIVVD